jgi:Domain of Unknown Function (DUF1259).
MSSIGFARSLTLPLFAAGLLAAGSSAAQPQPPAWIAVDQALGRAGAPQPDGVRRYSFPRSDLHVQLDGVAIKPALALGGWVAFEPMGQNAVAMGDLVLTPEEGESRHDRAAQGRLPRDRTS